MNRWIVAAGAVAVQAGLGSFYAWSVFRGPLSDLYGAGVTEVNAAFFLASLTFSLAALGAGFLMRRVEPRAIAVAGGLLYGLGIFGAGLAGENLPFLYLTYGLLSGVGLGFGYVVPVAVLPRWFPERPGLAYGLAVCGFGAGPMIGAPLATVAMAAAGGPLSAFVVLGPAYALVVGGAALLLKSPPGFREPAREPSGGSWTLRGALRTWQWYATWATFFLNTTAGLAIISDARTMAAALGGGTAALASAFVVILAAGDTSGRLLWPALSDKIGRTNAFLTMFLLQAACFLLLPIFGAGSFWAFSALAFVVLTCYGGGYATIGALVETYYGPGDLAAIYGSVVVASGVAGLGAPVLLSLSADATGSYAPALYATAALMLAGAVVPLALKPPGAPPP